MFPEVLQQVNGHPASDAVTDDGDAGAGRDVVKDEEDLVRGLGGEAVRIGA